MYIYIYIHIYIHIEQCIDAVKIFELAKTFLCV